MIEKAIEETYTGKTPYMMNVLDGKRLDQNPALLAAIKLFNKRNPEWEVELIFIEHGDTGFHLRVTTKE
jgi:hypothetical protein